MTLRVHPASQAWGQPSISLGMGHRGLLTCPVWLGVNSKLKGFIISFESGIKHFRKAGALTAIKF